MNRAHPIITGVRLIATVALPVAFVAFMWFAWRYNFELSHMVRREMATCMNAAPQFVVATIKGTSQCVEASAAARFADADKFSQIALAVCAACFGFLFFDQRLKARNAPNP